MPFNFNQITLVVFSILAVGGAFLVFEKENSFEIDNISPTEPAILGPQTENSNIFPREDTEEPVETTKVPEIEVQTPAPEPAQPPTQTEIINKGPSIETPPKEPIVSTPAVSWSDINVSTREAVVNILCTTKSNGSFKPISGSGVIIDEHGIILTNAHIAQYFLLQDYLTSDFISCTIRTGSPAKPTYNAELLYISAEWIEENANNLNEESPKGTGENDFALLRITEPANLEKALPETFPFIEVSTEDTFVTQNTNVLLAGYSAGFLGGIAIQKDLYMSSTVTKIMEVDTFTTVNIDLFSVGGSVVAQAGASGGAVVDERSKLLGIIVTSSEGETTAERDLRALSLPHINRALIQNNGTTLSELLSGDLKTKADMFNDSIAPELKKLLTDVLDK